MPDGQI
jgi:hypothetical protein